VSSDLNPRDEICLSALMTAKPTSPASPGMLRCRTRRRPSPHSSLRPTQRYAVVADHPFDGVQHVRPPIAEPPPSRRCRTGIQSCVRNAKVKTLVAIAAAGALAVPVAADAKGPDQAKITGRGLDRPIVLSGYGESGQGTMGRLTMEGGFFPQAFGDSPDPRLPKEPANLGPRYRVDYRVSGPTAPVTLHQDLYPYASGGPVTYMPPGQRFWAGQQTKGGWMRAPELAPGQETLRAALVKAGLPKSAPARGWSSARGTVGWIAAGMVAAALGAIALLTLRRRPPSAETSTRPGRRIQRV
jgi:hypothetical protein